MFAFVCIAYHGMERHYFCISWQTTDPEFIVLISPNTTKIRIYIPIFLQILITEVLQGFSTGGDPLNSISSSDQGNASDILPLNTFKLTTKGVLSRLSTPQSQGVDFAVPALIKASSVYLTANSSQLPHAVS